MEARNNECLDNMSIVSTDTDSKAPAKSITARALLLGERLDTVVLATADRGDVVNTVPLALKVGDGFAVLFRYGVAVLIGLSPAEEHDTIRNLQKRVIGRFDKIEDETAAIEISDTYDDQIPPGGPIQIKDLSPQRLVVIADALAKNVALTRDEREVSRVFEVIEPLAADLAKRGRTPVGRANMLRLIGRALLVRHRMTGRVEVEEKPDVLWDRWDLERLHSRLADEYELKERATILARKLEVVSETARALTELIDASRSLRLEVLIVLLIVVEVLLALYELFFKR